MQIYLPIGYRLNFPISAFLQIHNISADSYIICRYHPYLQIYPCRMPQHHESVGVHLQITYADNFVYLQITYLICRYFSICRYSLYICRLSVMQIYLHIRSAEYLYRQICQKSHIGRTLDGGYLEGRDMALWTCNCYFVYI